MSLSGSRRDDPGCVWCRGTKWVEGTRQRLVAQNHTGSRRSLVTEWGPGSVWTCCWECGHGDSTRQSGRLCGFELRPSGEDGRPPSPGPRVTVITPETDVQGGDNLCHLCAQHLPHVEGR